MAQFISNGGCYNAMRWANDGAGQGARDWAALEDESITIIPIGTVLILATAWDSDDMNTIDGDFQLRWRNKTDAGSFAVMTGSGEIKWASSSDLVNGNAVVDAERLGAENCSGMGVSHADGTEREGANAIDLTNIGSGDVFDNHWAIDTSDATANKEYEFDVVETGTSNSYATLAGTLSVVTAGKIDGTTKNIDRSSAVGGVTVSAFRSDDAGSDPKPIGALTSQTVSHASTGVYSLTGLASGLDYFLHFYKDDTADLSDGSPVVTAVDV
jgi:hypothetical protein